ncbi:10113_t:CDS:2, partial [Funneliformis caledonium]
VDKMFELKRGWALKSNQKYGKRGAERRITTVVKSYLESYFLAGNINKTDRMTAKDMVEQLQNLANEGEIQVEDVSEIAKSKKHSAEMTIAEGSSTIRNFNNFQEMAESSNEKLRSYKKVYDGSNNSSLQQHKHSTTQPFADPLINETANNIDSLTLNEARYPTYMDPLHETARYPITSQPSLITYHEIQENRSLSVAVNQSLIQPNSTFVNFNTPKLTNRWTSSETRMLIEETSIQQKWDALLQKFCDIKDKIESTGEEAIQNDWEFFNDMDNFLRKDPKQTDTIAAIMKEQYAHTSEVQQKQHNKQMEIFKMFLIKF